jgi:hypothetical protein
MKKLSTKALLALVLAVAAAITVGGAAFAAQSQGGTRPGWGYGDKNHVHTGPPGQSVAAKP